jgi:hypothetical protein
MTQRFSKRHGHRPTEIEIRFRNEAPQPLRDFIIQLIYDLGYKPSSIRHCICRVLRVTPDRNNWTEFPNIDVEVSNLLSTCEWYYVYDVIEYLWDDIDSNKREEYQDELNDYFKVNGIGWKIEFGQVEIRGDKTFETSIINAEEALEKAKLQTAKTEIIEALKDLSRRPSADITGSIQHSLACLECVCREVTGDRKATLGELIKRFPEIVPKPLDTAIEKLWGFTSEQGRHLREGNTPNFEEAELVVVIASALSSYLAKRIQPTNINEEENLPF